jgi:cyclopropane-fatty-acyl-phospholipid synthase
MIKLRKLVRKIFRKKKRVKDLFDEKFVKMWEFYMASCAAAFRYRDLSCFSITNCEELSISS